MERRSKYREVEITGEVRETRPSDADDDDVYIEFKNSSQTNVRCVVNKTDAIVGKLQPGTTITVLGSLGVSPRHAYVHEGRISIK